MCCVSSKSNTEAFLKKNRRRKTVTVYKKLNRSIVNETLFAVYFGKEYKPGENKSNSNRKLVKSHGVEVNRGIHVWLNPGLISSIEAGVTIKFTALLKDLVCVGVNSNHAVFTKVTLARSEYEKALRY